MGIGTLDSPPLLSVLSACYCFIGSAADRRYDAFLRLPKEAKDELGLLLDLAFVIVCDLRAPLSERIYATDSCKSGGALVYVDAADSSPLFETRTAKGWLARLPRGVGPLSAAGSESGRRGWEVNPGDAGISWQRSARGLDGTSLTSKTPATAAPCKRLVCGLVKLATRADHRTNPSATYIGPGLSRRPSSTNLATTLELRPAMPAKPGGSGPTGAKDIKIQHHDDDQQCL
jgi:hypothetical protein